MKPCQPQAEWACLFYVLYLVSLLACSFSQKSCCSSFFPTDISTWPSVLIVGLSAKNYFLRQEDNSLHGQKGQAPTSVLIALPNKVPSTQQPS